MINLNTIPSSTVFGAMASNPVFGATWDKFQRSRLGTGLAAGGGGNYYAINPTYPSRFMQPFRTGAGAALSASLSPAYKTNSEPPEIAYTLLRPDPDNPDRPLFQVDNVSAATNIPVTDYNRNSYFRYQALQQLGGVASTHSNVFAVWITVGYFAVSPATNPNLKDSFGNLVYPDGMQLGQELGSDQGDVIHHRAFYIFDRSLQGNGLLLRRFIE